MNRIKPRDRRNLFFHDGWWWVDIQIKGQRYREKAGATEAKARDYRDKLRSWGRDSAKGLPSRKPEGEVVTFKESADNYLNLYSKLEKRAWKRDEISIAHLNAFFAGAKLKDITADDAARYRISRAAADISPKTTNVELGCLRAICRKALADGKISEYPLGTRKLLQKVKPFKSRILTVDEARRVIAAADPRQLRPAIIVWLNTGLRKMELLKLKREDVDFRERLITVIAENSKNGKARTIPMNATVAEILSARPGKVYFFENPATGKPVVGVIRAFRTALDKVGIKDRVRLHDLRHTHATWQIKAGVDVKTLSENLGHADAKMTLDLYCHSSLETKRAAVALIPDLTGESRHKVHADAEAGGETASESVN